MAFDLLEKKSLVEQYLQETEQRLSSFSFVNVYAWKDFFDFDFQVIDNALCIFARNEMGMFLYLPPLGKNVTRDVIRRCFEVMEQENTASGVSRIENVYRARLSLFPQEEFDIYKKGYEYSYFRKDLVTLRGNRYKSKRLAYNHFVKNYRYQYLPYEDSMVDKCRVLYERWAQNRENKHCDELYVHMLKENRGVHRLILRNSKQLGLTGRVVRVNNEICAYSFGFPLNNESFCILLETADLNIKGVAAFIFREFCADQALKNFKFVNVMDDFGLENIAKTKLSFHPGILEPMYVVTRKRENK